jgi:hypothetical protein
MSYQLFIDDERDPPDDGWEWIIARSSAEAIMTFHNLGCPEHVSFDHDLGGDDTSIKFIEWVITRCLELIDLGINPGHITFIESYVIHSQNPVGAQNIDGKIKGFIKYLEETCW